MRLTYLFYFLRFPTLVNAQDDKEWLSMLLKVEIYQNMVDYSMVNSNGRSPNEISLFIDECDLSYDTLNYNLPENYLFFEVYSANVLNCSSIPFYGENNYPVESFILCINRITWQVYKLKGFLNNDFNHLLDDLLLSFNRYGRPSLYKSRRAVIKKSYVENLDLKRLFKGSKSKSKI